MNQDFVVLVNEFDHELGQMEKLEAHKKGVLHRAFSVFIFNSNHELLLQRRAFGKYHSEGLWTNTCCSHPYPGEDILIAGNRRLMEEMGMYVELFYKFSFVYKAFLENNLIEHELDHVLIGISDDIPKLNLNETTEFKWMSLETIKQEIDLKPEKYTSWFKIIMNDYIDQFKVVNSYESM